MVKVGSITSPAPKGGVTFKQMDIDYEGMPIILKPVYTGICGTDRGIVSGGLQFAYPPDGYSDLVLGHESVCRVVSAGKNDFGISSGDLVVPQVRRPGNCLNCLAGRSDNCSDGDKHEAGVTGMHGFMREIFGDFPEYLVKVESSSIADIAVLTEPLKNVEKAFEMLEVSLRRSISTNNSGSLEGKRAIIIGTGSEAFLYSLKCRDYGFETFITNRHGVDELKLKFFERSRTTFFDYTQEPDMKGDWDLVIDTSGDPGTIFRFLRNTNNNGNVILFGTNGKAPQSGLDGVDIGRIVEKNIFILGSVDGARIHYTKALQDLERWASAYGNLLRTMLTSKHDPEDTKVVAEKQEGEIKSLIDWSK